ncbi:MAG: MFS transporter [Planctomycetota bacterium]
MIVTDHVSDCVPLRERLALGGGGVASFLGHSAIGALAIPIYQMTLGVNPALVGIALAIPRLWDGLIDLGVGRASDNARTRFGRRRPFIVMGAISSGLAFAVLWLVPESFGDVAAATYLMLVTAVFYTAFTVYSVPYQALIFEVSSDYDERTRVASYPTFFAKLAEAGYIWLVPLAQLAVFGSLIQGMRWVGIGIGVLVFAVLGSLSGLLVRERSARSDSGGRAVRIVDVLRQSWRLRAVRVLLVLIGLQSISGAVASTLDYYLIVYSMCDGDIAMGSVWKAVLSSGYAAVGVVGVFVARALAVRLQKHVVLVIAYVLVAVGGVVKWFVFTPGMPFLILLDPLFCGFVYAALGVVVTSMLADVCDEDESAFGMRREATYAGVFSFSRKAAGSLALLSTGGLLAWSGFDEMLGGDQPAGVVYALRVMLAGTTVLTAIGAIIALFRYPLSRASAHETKAALETRRGVREPVTLADTAESDTRASREGSL